MCILPILAVVFALLEAYALTKGLRKLEFVAKPSVIICLSIWLYLETGWRGPALWFGIGLLLSLAGDVFLLWIDRMFVFGLAAFLLGHLSYIVGLKDEFASISSWSLILAIALGLSAARVMRRIVSAIRAKGQTRLVAPVVLYSTVITVMLFAAMLTLLDISWPAGASLLVSAGAFVFYISDVVLAWNRFVAPIQNGRRLNIALYHAGQIMLVAGIIGRVG